MRASSLSSCRDFGLQAESVSVLRLGIGQRLGGLDLSSGVLVVGRVAQRSAVGTVGGQAEFFHQHRDDLVAGSIIGKFYGNALVLGRVVHRNVDRGHVLWVPVPSLARLVAYLLQFFSVICAFGEKV